MIEFVELDKIIRRRFWTVVIPTLIMTLLGLTYVFFISKPVYRAESTLCVINQSNIGQDGSGTVEYDDLLAGQLLIKNYKEIARSQKVASMVIETLRLQDVTSEEISERTEVDTLNDSSILVISYTDSNPEQAARIVNLITVNFANEAKQMMSLNNIKALDAASVPTNPVAPNKPVLTMAFVFFGLFMGLAIAFLMEYFNDVIGSSGSIEELTGLSVVGIIPDFERNK